MCRTHSSLRLGRRLTLVCAPPGFGKTTLIREWCGGAGRAVAWLASDENDNDAARFLCYVPAAVRALTVGAAADGDADQGAMPGRQPTAQDLLVSLINDVNRSGAELLLVLDD